ncbi:MAG: thioredoxin fold domain-containing protein [Cyanobacteria bacterium RI_101]|nr:thioredoxin fold domain-containing protein [Cyanobacteria bacterium RI_101]
MPHSSFPWRRGVLALTAILLSAALYFGFQSQGVATSLETQAKQSLSLETALSNGKPTLTEFYANWCRSCQAMAPSLARLKQDYGDRVNFVMLNVDNGKWLPEVLRYRVDGIPHFVFQDGTGNPVAQAVGELPQEIMAANLAALMAGEPLPYARSEGRTSPLQETSTPAASSDPRSHGAPMKP